MQAEDIKRLKDLEYYEQQMCLEQQQETLIEHINRKIKTLTFYPSHDKNKLLGKILELLDEHNK